MRAIVFERMFSPDKEVILLKTGSNYHFLFPFTEMKILIVFVKDISLSGFFLKLKTESVRAEQIAF